MRFEIFKIVIVLLLGIFLQSNYPIIVWGACNPAECGESGLDPCGSGRSCVAKCCVSGSSTPAPTPTPTATCNPDCPKSCGGGDGCGGTCPNSWGSWSPSAPACGSVTQTKTNDCGDTKTQTSTCTECGPYVSWTACDAFHKTIQVTSYDCSATVYGTPIDCKATVTGTLFDATNLSSCPSDIGTNPAYASIRLGNQSFGLTGTWPVISSPVSTGIDGNYSEQVYASTVSPNYSYDYTNLVNSGLVDGVKFECQSTIVSALSNNQIIVKDTGFYKNANVGWWQVVGGSVTAKGSVFSTIPALTDATKRKLILQDANLKDGLLSFGTGVSLGSYGSVSTSNNQFNQSYGGTSYTYDYFANKFFNLGQSWAGGDLVSYTQQNAEDYRLLKVSGSLDLASGGSVTINGGKKYIILVDGDVNVKNSITISSGSFLAVIARGKISFNPEAVDALGVNRFDGWYLGNEIDFGSTGNTATELQFVGNGSFVAWSNFYLNRDRGSQNAFAPSEIFTYRADLLESAPEVLKENYKYYERYNP